MEILALLLFMAVLLFLCSGQSNESLSNSMDFLISRYGFTEDEARTFNYIADPAKRDLYMNHVIRSKRNY